MSTEVLEEVRHVPPDHKVTFEEFLDWCDEDTWAEWVDGDVIMVSPASMPHQDIGSFLENILRPFVEVHRLGKIFRAPFLMRMQSISRGREPDLFFAAKERLNLLEHNYFDGAADLVIEIVSPESVGRDRGDKFVEYERVGVREYWLLDPDRRTAEFYELGADGRYSVAPIGGDGIYRSKVIQGFWLQVDWLWQTPLPQVVDILRELTLV
jgi:Uma2 family endonuclease